MCERKSHASVRRANSPGESCESTCESHSSWKLTVLKGAYTSVKDCLSVLFEIFFGLPGLQFLLRLRVVQYTQTESDRRRPWETRLTGSQFARDLVNIQQSIVEEGVENVSKRPPSDPMETGCCSKSQSHCRESVRKRRQTDSIGSDGDGLPSQDSIGLPRVSSRETW